MVARFCLTVSLEDEDNLSAIGEDSEDGTEDDEDEIENTETVHNNSIAISRCSATV